MVKINSTFESPSVIGGEKNVDFLKKRWLTVADLYVMNVLPENGDLNAFVEEMREVEDRALYMGVRLRWTGEDDGSMAYVTPKEAGNTIFFNLRTLAFDSQHKGTLLMNSSILCNRESRAMHSIPRGLINSHQRHVELSIQLQACLIWLFGMSLRVLLSDQQQ
jgi:hypothetical protein